MEEAGPSCSGANVPVSPPGRKAVEQFVTRMRRVLDDVATQISTVVKMFNGRWLRTSDVCRVVFIVLCRSFLSQKPSR